jgi:hypothetical protein
MRATISHRNQTIKVRIRPQRTLRNQLLATRRAFLVSAPQSCDDAVAAEAVQALLRRHRLLQHIETDGTPANTQSFIGFWRCY